ncbi:hypothetical protein RRU01S_25_00390 [Agrobacterium rubi TR3 = NBRC 13261]|uniref:DUF2339 domain-containing protein n=1 Tax=Agrobacterium rubi TR3 = NBRC 13261 TaxID=1368415 RepID=A0A081D0A3_9HYPH|nr:DUF2339 domain-containing protein [Agrobacterium rubi]MBP1878349.1 putative membrane protein [Agrobacterium rubi]GAK72349.1 hypothetical protein RRU01S_25_00390 [Agrobacterium rubi TR3 = NBRC 13261]
MTSFLLLLIFGYIVAFFYTLNASIKNSRRLEVVEAELKDLKAKVAAGVVAVTEPAPIEDMSAEDDVLATMPQADTAPAAEDVELPVAARVSTEESIRDDIAAAVFAPTAPRKTESFESQLGARWAVWAGGLALALGGIFLVKYSIESGLLSPAVRLGMAAVFGLLLAAAGEAIRRKAVPSIASAYSNAMIPGILTAAGAATLFGVTYAAYGIYEYIGPTTAFILLALVGFATIALSLLHGQALAGLGLLGSMVTPALISSESPNIWALFSFLTVSWLATAAASRRQHWHVVPALANIGLGLWAISYMVFAPLIEAEPVVASLIAMIAGSIWIWPGKYTSQPRDMAVYGPRSDSYFPVIAELLGRPPASLNVTLALAIVLPALAFSVIETGITMHPAFAMAVLVLGLAAIGAGRNHAVWPAIFASLAALGCANLLAGFGVNYLPSLGDGSTLLSSVGINDAAQAPVTRIMGILFLLFSFEAVRRKTSRDPSFGALWAFIGSVVPLGLGIISFVQYGNLTRDWLHAAYGLSIGLVLLGSAYRLDRKRDAAFVTPINIMVIGSFLAFIFIAHTLTSGLATIILIPTIGFAYVLGTRRSSWAALPWTMALACLFVLGRIAWEPTIVGPQNLGTTPVFNALLPGYGIPALLAIASAWLLRDWPGARVKNFLQAIASLMGLLAIAILVRHAMNGGVLNAATPTLGEQSIYTLLTIGMSGVLMTLDLKSPSPVFRYGSMVAGVIAMFNVLFAHFYGLNPYLTGESTGPWPFFNLLLIGYLLPAIAYAGLALYARGKRPALYVTLLALSGAALGFAWATLSVRRFWQGENIADWKGFLQGETYSYSVVWLVIGVALLVLGSRFNAKSLRLASAALVFLAVAKAFLIDMSNLEGVLRALSFIGLGVVLIGIGLFYQKILTSQPKQQEAQG